MLNMAIYYGADLGELFRSGKSKSEIKKRLREYHGFNTKEINQLMKRFGL